MENTMSNNGIEDIVSQPRNEYTEPLFFIPGKYTLSQVGQVPYFSSVIPLEDLVGQIKLVENISEDTELTVSLEGLFQRDIDWDRVKNKIVNGYLKQQNKLNFFNSLTIALLPGTGSKIEDNYGEPEHIPSPTYENWKKIDIGNICVEFNSDDSLGVLRWHKKRVFPVAIDGQHRLAALKEYCKDLTTENPPELNTKVPIIFLILHKDVGFEGRQGSSLIATLREIFIDLNKHARVVSKSRVILLDDLDIQSFCVRTLLDSDEIDSYPEVLPLSMVTWRENDVKFDTGYSITTVLNLNEIVDSCLSGASLDGTSSLEENEVKRYIDKIKGKLELSNEVQKSINNHLQLCTNREEPFSFKDEHLDAFKEAFRSQWTPHIVRVFREFEPYEKYLSTAEEIGAIDGTLSDYLLKSKENRETFKISEKEINNKFDPVEMIDNPLNKLLELKKNEWAFYVVFQRALFINFFQFETQREALFEEAEGESREGFLTWWLGQINVLHARGVFNLDWKAGKSKADLWRGIANNPASGTIQYSNAAVNCISSFITICVWFNYNPAQLDVKTFVGGLTKEIDIELPPIVHNSYSTLKGGLTSLIKFEMNTDEIDDGELQKKIKSALVKRLKATQE